MKIAIDVVPIQTGGHVGGAMHLTVELIRGLSRTAGIEIVLLTAHWNNAYFSSLFSQKNITTVIVLPQELATDQDNSLTTRIKKVVSKIMRKIDNRGILHKHGVEILFCPMGAVTYHEQGIPTVSTINDIQHEYYPQFFAAEELAHRRTAASPVE